MNKSLRAAFLLFLSFAFIPLCVTAQSQDLPVIVEISEVQVGAGDVLIAIFATADSYKKEQPLQSIILLPDAATLRWNLSLPPGAYVVSAFQDSNGNRKLDKNFFGMPRERFALSNYDGKGIPGGFNALKIQVERAQQLLSSVLIQM